MPRWEHQYRHSGGRKQAPGTSVKGANEVSRILKEIGAHVVEAAKAETKRQADIIAEDARTRCPVKTGALRDSIKVTPSKDGLVCRISANARNSKGKQWPNFAYGQVVEYAPAHLGGHPFLHPAMDAHRDAAMQAIYDAVQKAMRGGSV